MMIRIMLRMMMIYPKKPTAVRRFGLIILLHYLCIMLMLLLISQDNAFPIIIVRRIISSPQPFTIIRSMTPSSSPSYYRGSSFKGLLILHRSKPFILYARRQAPEISDQLELFEDYDEYDGESSKWSMGGPCGGNGGEL